MPVTTAQEHAAEFHRTSADVIARLSPSPLRDLASEAIAIYRKGWDDETGSGQDDAIHAKRFFAVIDKILATPAETAHDAAAKVLVISLLYECDFPDDAQTLSAALVADLVDGASI